LSSAAALALISASCSSPCIGAADQTQVVATLAVPGKPLEAFDVSWFDAAARRLYVADRGNAGVEVFDAETRAYVRRIEGFTGDADHDHSGPNGVVAVPGQHELWVGDGDSTVKVVSLDSGAVDSVSTGGSARADELSYDSDDHIVLVVNNAEAITEDPASGPFATLISTQGDHRILGKLVFHDASAGLEQSVWDPRTHRFYLAIPELNADAARGAIAVIDPRAARVVELWPVAECEPAGLALGPAQHLLLGCSGDAIEAGYPAKSIILSTRDGTVTSTISEVGGSDEVWFNPGDMRYYLAARDNPSGPVLGIIDAVTNRYLASIPTAPDAKSVAVDPVSNLIFVPLPPITTPLPSAPGAGSLDCARGCVAVYSSAESCVVTK
jgi:DNA-binding beta-propeller fold protein YncE